MNKILIQLFVLLIMAASADQVSADYYAECRLRCNNNAAQCQRDFLDQHNQIRKEKNDWPSTQEWSVALKQIRNNMEKCYQEYLRQCEQRC